MVSLQKVPIVEVNKDNLVQLWPAMVLAIKSSTFISLDTELSGLGNRKLLNAKIMDERYHHMCEVARTRSVVALGVSCFKRLSKEDREPTEGNQKSRPARKLNFQVQTFNIMLLCSEQYVVEPNSLRFLVNHGFDFNLQYSKGLPYHRGSDTDEDLDQSVRNIFSEIVLAGAPVVLHNAVVDLVFLYHNLYAPLPTSEQAFIADLAQMFPGGVYDTKYITDFKARMGASFLEFVFKKCHRGNILSSKKGWSHIDITLLQYARSSYITYVPCEMSIGKHCDADPDIVCTQYSNHGWCPAGSDCDKSHDLDVILDIQEHSSITRSPPHNGSVTEQHSQGDTSTTEASKSALEPKNEDNTPFGSINKACSHTAGFDAFMTGYIFAFYTARYSEPSGEKNPNGSEQDMLEYKNKLYLVGKDIPLQVAQSSFSKPSKGHRIKMAKIKP